MGLSFCVSRFKLGFGSFRSKKCKPTERVTNVLLDGRNPSGSTYKYGSLQTGKLCDLEGNILVHPRPLQTTGFIPRVPDLTQGLRTHSLLDVTGMSRKCSSYRETRQNNTSKWSKWTLELVEKVIDDQIRRSRPGTKNYQGRRSYRREVVVWDQELVWLFLRDLDCQWTKTFGVEWVTGSSGFVP